MSTGILQVQELEPLFEQVGDEVYSYARNLSRDDEIAADITQGVFLKFMERVRRGGIERKSAPAYLMRMAHNEFIDLRRKDQRLSHLAMENSLPADERREKIASDSTAIRRMFVQALTNPDLPPEVVEVLRMRFIQELSVGDICEQLEKSRTTVHRILRRGLDRLVSIFEEAGLNPEALEQ